MARMTYAGRNDDGSPHYNIKADPGEHVVLTGPIVGPVEVDGKTLDVSAPFVVAESPAHALAISDAIGKRYETEGHPQADGFVHTPSKLTHDKNGNPKDTFTAAVDAQAKAGADSSPQGVIDALTKK